MSPGVSRVLRPLVLIPVVALASYFLMALLPTQVEDDRKEQLPPELIASYRKDLGLGEPLGFLRPWTKLFRGERLGTSAQGVTVDELGQKLVGSLSVGALALALALLWAFAFSGARVRLGERKGQLLADGVLAAALGTPTFLLALLFAPAVVERGGVLPDVAAALVISVWPGVFLGSLLTDALRSELAKDYVRTARAKGVSARGVFLRHVLPNVMPALLDALAPVATAVLGGSFAAERVLGLPYFGQLYVMAVLQRQVAVVVVATTIFSALLAIVTALIEAIRQVIDPRAGAVE